jgi:cysteine desulfuration protein SufE
MNHEINEIQDKIIEEFSKLNDWYDKYEYLIDLGKSLKLIDEEFKIEKNLISGCQTNAWLIADIRDEKVHYLADSDSIITKGLIFLLLRVLNDQYPEDIVNIDLYFIDEIGLSSNLSPSRANGLKSLEKQIKSYAKMAPNFNNK